MVVDLQLEMRGKDIPTIRKYSGKMGGIRELLGWMTLWRQDGERVEGGW